MIGTTDRHEIPDKAFSASGGKTLAGEKGRSDGADSRFGTGPV